MQDEEKSTSEKQTQALARYMRPPRAVQERMEVDEVAPWSSTILKEPNEGGEGEPMDLACGGASGTWPTTWPGSTTISKFGSATNSS